MKKPLPLQSSSFRQWSNKKENNLIQNFIKELSNYLEKANNQLSNRNDNNRIKINSLKQEECLYQVVEMDVDGAYLQNTNNNRVSKETDISKEVLDKIAEIQSRKIA